MIIEQRGINPNNNGNKTIIATNPNKPNQGTNPNVNKNNSGNRTSPPPQPKDK